MSIIERPAPIATSPAPATGWRRVILAGPYLKRMRCNVLVDPLLGITDCDRIHSVFSHTHRFEAWFVRLYHPAFLDGYGLSRLSGPGELASAQRDNGE
jgi:hypothetical protein